MLLCRDHDSGACLTAALYDPHNLVDGRFDCLHSRTVTQMKLH